MSFPACIPPCRCLAESLETRRLLAAPPLGWASYVGGASDDFARSVAVDASGSVYVAGNTNSVDWVGGGFDNVPGGGGFPDAFVAKINPDGTLAWSSYLGGGAEDAIYGIAVDSAGNVFVAGHTASSNIAAGGYDLSFGGHFDGFVSRINANGTLAWTTYLGGSGFDSATGISVDSAGNPYVSGYTGSAGWVSRGHDTTYAANNDSDGFIVKLTPAGAHVWSSYIGGDLSDSAYGIAVDSGGNAYVTGQTYSNGWTSGGFDNSYDGIGNAFVARFNANGSLSWSSYISATFWPVELAYGNSIGFAVDTDAAGNAYVTGDVWSGDFDSGKNIFVCKVSAAGTRQWIVYPGSTTGDDSGRAIAVDNSGNIFIAGQTNSSDFAVNGFDTTFGGYDGDGFVAMLQPTGALAWSSYLGGAAEDYARGIAVATDGSIYVAGYTASSDVGLGAGDVTSGGATDGFVARIGSAAGSLVVDGTAGDDTIVVRATGSSIEVVRNGLVVASRDASAVTSVVIDALAGHDRIDILANVGSTIQAGDGNDIVNGGNGADLIYGGNGDDALSGGEGADTIYGNFGNDQIAGGLRRDSVLGGLGNDTITAGDGPDFIYGGDGTDLLRGGKGADLIEGRGKADSIYGGAGNDTIYGGAGADLLAGEDDDDWLYAAASPLFRDTLDGGAGTDRYESDFDDVLRYVEYMVLA